MSSAADRSLRILFTAPVPFLREFGISRGPVDLAAELRLLGHHVEVFDRVAAFGPGGGGPGRLQRLRPLGFAKRARAYVREHGHRFDVIDSTHGDLPYSKAEIGFDGLLVARSSALYAPYDEYARFERMRWPGHRRGTAVGRLVHRWASSRQVKASRRSLEHADLIVVPNQDEAEFVRERLGLGDRCLLLPLGLRDADAQALDAAALPARERLARRQVSFVGSWVLRKGLADWGEIVAKTRERVPDARFCFLGTGSPAEQIVADVGTAEGISVVPHFRAEELPSLLAGSTAGAVPSYVESWGFAVLEQLAARLPVVAYDLPGPRTMLGPLESDLIVPRGAASALADRLARLLTLDEDSYTTLAERCAGAAARYRWPELARATVAAYAAALEGSASTWPKATSSSRNDGSPESGSSS